MQYFQTDKWRQKSAKPHAHSRQNGINQLTLRQGEVRVVVAGQNVAKLQRHPYLCKGGHAGVHDPHPSPCGGPGKVLPRYA